MRSFLTHTAAGLAGCAFALSLSFGWVRPDGRNYENSVFAQNTVVALLAVTVLILVHLQRRALPPTQRIGRSSRNPTPIGD